MQDVFCSIRKFNSLLFLFELLLLWLQFLQARVAVLMELGFCVPGGHSEGARRCGWHGVGMDTAKMNGAFSWMRLQPDEYIMIPFGWVPIYSTEADSAVVAAIPWLADHLFGKVRTPQS